MDLSKLQNGSDVRGVALAGVENEPVTLDDAAVRAILRSGLYQARYLKSAPLRAALRAFCARGSEKRAAA